jgi:di/tricarboxylate transporter
VTATPVEVRLGLERGATLVALIAVAVAALAFDLNIGIPALLAAVTLHLAFPRGSRGAERDIAWSVVLLVCGIVTYVAALQRFGTVDAIGGAIAGLGSPLAAALLICAVGAITSAFASSAGILGALMVLAMPFIAQGDVNAAGFVAALAISATVVDACPFSTAGALVVANAPAPERDSVYRGLLTWGAIMAVTAPVATCLLFVAFAP